MQRVLRSIRSTPLRLTAILVTIFILSSVVSFATAYFVIRATFDSTLEDEINQRVATYQAIDDQNDLIEWLKDDAETLKPELLILQYLPDQGLFSIIILAILIVINVDGSPKIVAIKLAQIIHLHQPKLSL